jgi:hypothetical protein
MFVSSSACGGPAFLSPLADATPGSYHFACRRLAGIDLRLEGVALGYRCALLVDERFLFHSHLLFLQVLIELLYAIPYCKRMAKLRVIPANRRKPENNGMEGSFRPLLS